MITDTIHSLIRKENLSSKQAKSAMDAIMDGKVSEVQIAAFLTALACKGESIDEITASVRSLKEHCECLECGEVLEIVGTGGDGSHSFNISSTASLIIASGGVKVAKHGNRAFSSKCGAADVFEALGVNISLPKDKAKALIEKTGFCFLFAQNYHSAMKNVAPVRKELAIRTIFNIIGPLCNPANPQMQIMGVYEQRLLAPMAKVLQNLGVRRALVVYGLDKLDEISLSAPTQIYEVNGEKISTYTISPQDFGYEACDKNALRGGDASQNATILKEILSGKERGAKLQVACLNAGAGLYLANKADSIKDGVALAQNLIDSGKAAQKLEEIITKSNE
ncbi:anthranilate phosphoribosyltransferase [Helicobacter sp. T3_23-1056]